MENNYHVPDLVQALFSKWWITQKYMIGENVTNSGTSVNIVYYNLSRYKTNN